MTKGFSPIITDPLDLDIYKLNMQQFAWYNGYNLPVEYKFQLRDPSFQWVLDESAYEIAAQIESLESLRFDCYKLLKCGFRNRFASFLENDFLLNPKEQVEINLKPFSLRVKNGSWVDLILYETYILSIISEIVGKKFARGSSVGIDSRTRYKVDGLCKAPEGFAFTDFSTRRRFSKGNQDLAISTTLSRFPSLLAGTSNAMFGLKYGLPIVGTMAHEYLQAFQVLGSSLRSFQEEAFAEWMQFYKTANQVALTDIVGFDAFVKYSKALNYKGFRHDSGDPHLWARKLVKIFGKRSKEKTVVFSDGLDFKKAFDLFNEFKDSFNQCSFGIGTYFGNHDGFALPIVLKMVKFDGKPVAKISDSAGKGMCEDAEYLTKLKYTFGI